MSELHEYLVNTERKDGTNADMLVKSPHADIAKVYQEQLTGFEILAVDKDGNVTDAEEDVDIVRVTIRPASGVKHHDRA